MASQVHARIALGGQTATYKGRLPGIAEEALIQREGRATPQPFALLRIVTTRARFLKFAGAIPMPGDWFHLEIEARGIGLPTWHAQLVAADGYSSHARGVTTYARRLDAPDDMVRHG